MKTYFKISIFVLLVGFIACKSVQTKTTTHENNNASEAGHLPLASQWIIESFAEKNFENYSKASYITIAADLKSFTGNGACNSIFGSIETKANEIKFKKVTSTKIFCDQMQQEDLFLNNLSQTTHYKIVGGELFLYQNETLLMTLESFRN